MSEKPRPWRFSYSQISMLAGSPREACRAKYAFKYVDGIRAPPHPSAVYGTQTHSIAQAGLRGTQPDTQTDHGRSAATLMAMTPRPWEDLVIEPEYDWTEEDLIFLAKPDLLRLPDDGSVWIGDYKTTGRIGRWTMSDEKLLTDVQAQLYSRWAFRTFPIARVDLHWMTVEKGTQRRREAKASIDRSHNDREFSRLRLAAEDARGILRSGKGGREVQGNPEACEAFGGCPYRSICPSSPALFGGFVDMSNVPPGVNTALNFLQGAPSPQATPPQVYGAPGSVGVDGYKFPPGTWVKRRDTGHVGVVQQDGLVWINVNPPGMPVGYAPQHGVGESAYEVIPPPDYSAQAQSAPALQAAPPAINPPESSPNTTLQQSAQTYVDIHRAEKLEMNTAGMNPTAAAAVNQALAGAPTSPPAPEAPKKTRAKKEKPTEAEKGGTKLVFVDCHPTGLELQSYSAIFETARAQIQAETGIASPQAFEFGKGMGVLIAKLQTAVLEDWIHVRSSAYGAEAFIQILETKGYVVVR